MSNGSGSAIAVRFWDFGDPGSGTANNSAAANPTHIYSDAGTYFVDLIVTTTAGCSDTITDTITITPPPSVDFSSATSCSGDTTQFNSSSFVDMTNTVSWLWQFGDGQTSTSPDPIHIYDQSGTYSVILTIVNNEGCPAAKTAPVIVSSGPVATFASSSPDCVGSSVVFTDLSAYTAGTITQWHWIFGDGNDTTYTSATPAISHVYTQSGNFMVTLTVNSQNGCESTFPQLITISPSPVAGFDYENTCEGVATQFNDQSTATSGINIVTLLWNFGDPSTGVNNTSSLQNPVHIFSAPGTYQVTLIALNATGCSDTIQAEVIIIPKPGVDFYTDLITCSENPLEFYTDTTATNIASVQSYNWNFGDGTSTSNLQNPVHNYVNPGNYNVVLTIIDMSGCSNFISHPLTIGESPVTSFSYANACEDIITQFNDLTYVPGNGNVVGWFWDFGVNNLQSDTSTIQNPSFMYTIPGIYTVTLTTTSESGCTSTKSQPVQIFTKPTAAFRYATTPCSNGSVQFQDSSYSNQSVITSWMWEFEPFQYSTLANPVYQYYALDSCYDVKLIIADIRGCMDTLIREICVPAPLAITFTYEKDCFGNPMLFVPKVDAPAGDSLISFNWNFGDVQSGTANNSTLKRPSHTFTSTGFYTVSLTAIDKFGCLSTNLQTIEVKALPMASFTYLPGQCDSTVVFTSSSIDTSGMISAYIWDFGDGILDTLYAPNNSITHKFQTEGTFVVTLTVLNGNGCSDKETINYTLNPCLLAAFSKVSQVECQNTNVSFNDLSVCQGVISEWEWNWGDNTPQSVYTDFVPVITHMYSQTGVYKVSLKVTTMVNGSPFSVSTSQNVTILTAPEADFNYSSICLGSRANFYNSTSTNGVSIDSYRWNFGDPANLNDSSDLRNPYYVYTVVGEYETQLIVTNQLGCSDTVAHNIRVNGLPTSAQDYSVACMGHSTYFFDHSDPYLAPIVYSGWVITDGTQKIGYLTGTATTFTFDSVGAYTVIHAVSDSNNCSDTAIYQINVVPSPVSVFNVSDNYENIQGQVQLENGSLGADEYYWELGNGETSYEESPVITYTEDGNYLIQLYARNNYGCVDSTGVLYKMLFKGLWIPNAFSVGPVQNVRLWKPIGVNLAYYRVDVYDRWGDVIWYSEKLTEKGSPAEGWDGTYKNVPCKEGVYVWKITAVFSDGSIWQNNDTGNRKGLSAGTSGTITLIR